MLQYKLLWDEVQYWIFKQWWSNWIFTNNFGPPGLTHKFLGWSDWVLSFKNVSVLNSIVLIEVYLRFFLGGENGSWKCFLRRLSNKSELWGFLSALVGRWSFYGCWASIIMAQFMGVSQMVTEIVPTRGQVRIFMKNFTFKRVSTRLFNHSTHTRVNKRELNQKLLFLLILLVSHTCELKILN